MRVPGFDAPWINVSGPSRLHSGVRDDLMHVIVVVDTTKLTGTTWQQIAYSGLTDWDESYLTALYDFNQERAASLQRNELINDIAGRELGEDDDNGRRSNRRSSSAGR